MHDVATIDHLYRYPVVAVELGEILTPEKVEIAYAYCNRKAMSLLIERKLLKWKEPQYNWDGTIDVEIYHPLWGWIPFTASPTDIEPYGREFFWWLHNDGVGIPYDYSKGLPDIARYAVEFPSLKGKPFPLPNKSWREYFREKISGWI